jgi:hypothetical protein
VFANAPAPWAVCNGKQAGDSCSSLYYPAGICVVDDFSCNETPSCLVCESRGDRVFAFYVLPALAMIGGAIALLLLRRRAARR